MRQELRAMGKLFCFCFPVVLLWRVVGLGLMSLQNFPERLEDGSFQLALKEIAEEARRRRSAEGTPVVTKFQREERESSVEPQTSNPSSSEGEGVEGPAHLFNENLDTGRKHLKHRAEIVQGKLKQMRLKTVHGREEDLRVARPLLQHKGEGEKTPQNVKGLKDRGGDVTRKRKRPTAGEEADVNRIAEEAEALATPESPSKKVATDLKLNQQGSGKKLNRSFPITGDPTKASKDGPRKTKRTGEDGVSFPFLSSLRRQMLVYCMPWCFFAMCERIRTLSCVLLTVGLRSVGSIDPLALHLSSQKGLSSFR